MNSILEITPRSRFFPEKLTGPQLVKKFSAFYGTRRFITAFTSARPPVHILSQINSVHASPPTSWRHVVILSSLLRLGLPSCLFPSNLPTKTLYTAHKCYPLRTFPTILVITLSELDVIMVPCVGRVAQSV